MSNEGKMLRRAVLDAFERVLLVNCHESTVACSYNPQHLRNLIGVYGGASIAVMLARSDELPQWAQRWLARLQACSRLDLSIEAAMLMPQFQELFTDGELAVAYTRLVALGHLDEIDGPFPWTTFLQEREDGNA